MSLFAGGAAPTLTPFVGRLADDARDRLLDLLELDAQLLDAKMATRSGGTRDWLAEIRIRLPSGRATTLELSAPQPDAPALFKTEHLACSYRSDECDPFDDPRDAAFFRNLRTRLSQTDAAGRTNAAVDALMEALARYQPFLSVKDDDYRMVFRAADSPVGLLWLGFGCNQDCVMCWQGRDWPSPPDEIFERWLDEFCAAGLTNIVLSGGEPTLHPLLPRWIAKATAAGTHLIVETNAIRFGEAGFIEELRNAGLNDVVVSLHAAEAALSDRLTGVPGSFAQTIVGLRRALAAELRVGVHCVVERANVASLEQHARFVADELRQGGHGVRQVSYSFPIAYHRRDLYSAAIPTLDEVRQPLSAAIAYLRAAGIDVRFLGMSGFPVCAVEHPEQEIDSLPNSIPDDLRSDRDFPEPCERCAVKPRCFGIHRTYVQVHGARGVSPLTR